MANDSLGVVKNWLMTEGQDGEEELKPHGDQAVAQPAASQTAAPFPGSPGQPGAPIAGSDIPPGVQPGQALQLLIHQGMASPQNPEVVRHVTTFLTHDSNNRLEYMKSVSERNHKFRMAALCVLGGLLLLHFSFL
jgi:hypothetical protein